MRERNLKTKGLSKGAPGGVLISIIFHAVLFLIAAGFVVFEVVKEDPPAFVPPEIKDRPKMKLRKPKVKLKKSAQPKQTTRIVTPKTKASMPDIQLPEMSGMTDGLLGGVGGFDIMPDLSEITMFGSGQSIGNDFVGTFYDMKRDRTGRPIPYDLERFKQDIKNFIYRDWNPSTWSKYYRSPRKLYTTTFAIPPVPSVLAPEAFGEGSTAGFCWIAHYKGQLVSAEDITFRFWGQGDDLISVKVDGEMVLYAPWPTIGIDFDNIWRSTSADSRQYAIGNNLAVVGDWITLKAGEALDMEVVVSEIWGGVFCTMLCVEVEGEEYPRNPFRGGPTLPIFKTEMPSRDLADAIWNDLDSGDATVTNGPIFRDFATKSRAAAKPEPVVVESDPKEEDLLRIWTLKDGKSFEAEFVAVMGDKVVLKNPKGRQQKVALKKLSGEDLNYIDLTNPPEFKIEFSKTSDQLQRPERPPWDTSLVPRPMQRFNYKFGARLKQRGSKPYNHELFVEYFAIGEEVDGDHWILLDRKSDTFIPNKENKYSHEYHGRPIRIERRAIRSDAPMRGVKYGGYLITMTDERGEIIQHVTSNDFLFDLRDKLKRLAIGAHFDREGTRTVPPRPTSADRPTWL